LTDFFPKSFAAPISNFMWLQTDVSNFSQKNIKKQKQRIKWDQMETLQLLEKHAIHVQQLTRLRPKVYHQTLYLLPKKILSLA